MCCSYSACMLRTQGRKYLPSSWLQEVYLNDRKNLFLASQKTLHRHYKHGPSFTIWKIIVVYCRNKNGTHVKPHMSINLSFSLVYRATFGHCRHFTSQVSSDDLNNAHHHRSAQYKVAAKLNSRRQLIISDMCLSFCDPERQYSMNAI